MTQFLSLAQKNTLSNIETCGILAGKLVGLQHKQIQCLLTKVYFIIQEQNELIITHMILPKQKGTSDSCTTMCEEEIFDYQDKYNLITIGWIHVSFNHVNYILPVID